MAVVLFPHRADGWRLGRAAAPLPPQPWDRARETCRVHDMLGDEHTVSLPRLYVVQDEAAELRADGGDLLSLPSIHEAIALHHIRSAFNDGRCCVSLGSDIVVVVNPYTTKLPSGPLYSQQRADAWVRHGGAATPHPYTVASRCFRRLLQGVDSSVLVTGDSGAGKTETAKALMHYFGTASAAEACQTDAEKKFATGLCARVMATNAILEAFGNAKTARNNNSSRFGKYVSLHFDEKGVLLGADIQAYLLEKSRVIRHGSQERAFHVFYALLRGSTPADLARLRLGRPQEYDCLRPGTTNRPGSLDDAAFFREVCAAMVDLGITSTEVDAVFNALAAVLHLLSVQFLETTNGCTVEDATGIRNAAAMLGVDAHKLAAALTTATFSAQGEVVVQRLPVSKAVAGRDGVCKWIYTSIFNWLLFKINCSLKPTKPTHRRIGLLDMFGFEDMPSGNYFEQLLINYANEVLQDFYDQRLFREQEREWQSEGVSFTSVQRPDNAACVEMLGGGRQSVMKLLDDECALSGMRASDDSFVSKLDAKFRGESQHPHFSRPKVDPGVRFCVRHYAGAVEYSAAQAVEKNADVVREEVVGMLTGGGGAVAAVLAKGSEAAAEPRDGGSPRTRAATVAGTFRRQIRELLTVLSGTEPYWCRCVKPNGDKRPGVFDGGLVLSQLVCGGVVPTLRLLRTGPRPYPLQHFARDYWVVAGDSSLSGAELVPRVRELLRIPAAQLQLGSTKAFLTHDARTALLTAAAAARRKAAALVRRAALGCGGRLRLAAVRAARERERLRLERLERMERERAEWARVDAARAKEAAAAAAARAAEHRSVLRRMSELEQLDSDRAELRRVGLQLLEAARHSRQRIDGRRQEEDAAVQREREAADALLASARTAEARRHLDTLDAIRSEEEALRARERQVRREAVAAERGRRQREQERAVRAELRRAADDRRAAERAAEEELRERRRHAAAFHESREQSAALKRREASAVAAQRARDRTQRAAVAMRDSLERRRKQSEHELAASEQWEDRRQVWLAWERDERSRAESAAEVRRRAADISLRQQAKTHHRATAAAARLSQHKRDVSARVNQLF